MRLLGSYHPRLAAQASQSDGQDIDDPLYGNVGGKEQQVGSYSRDDRLIFLGLSGTVLDSLRVYKSLCVYAQYNSMQMFKQLCSWQKVTGNCTLCWAQ